MKLHFIFGIFFLCCFIFVHAQFYNGMQTDFGKNRVQYRTFFWQYYRLPEYDVYFYENGSNLATYVATEAKPIIQELENTVGITLQKRIIFLVYNNINDFRQSNIGLITGNEQYNIGGTTQLIDNKVFLYYEGDHILFKKQIRAAVAEILINQSVFGTDFKAKVTNSTLLNLPDWYTIGLKSFLTEEWNSEIENAIRDRLFNKKFEKFNRLSGNDAVYAGHAMWFYIAQKYGKQTIPNILYLTRISKNVETGFLYTLGLPIKYLTYEWIDYYKKLFELDENKRITPEQQFISKKNKPNSYITNFKISPQNKYIAYCTNTMGRIKIYLKDLTTQKNTCIYRQGVKLEQIPDYSLPIIAWHPSEQLFAFITEKKGSKFLYTYDIENKELSYKKLFNVDKILDFSYSHNGFNLIMSAVKNGKTDLLVYNNAANSFEQITNDLADERYPQFFNQSKYIVFSSNRTSNKLKNDSIGKYYNIFVYDYANKDTLLTQITNNTSQNIMPHYINKNEFLFLNNESGLYNQYIALYDSTIDFIDTTIHYRYFTIQKPITNFSRSIIEHSFNNNQQAILFNFNNRFYSQLSELNTKTFTEQTATSPIFKELSKQKKVQKEVVTEKPLAVDTFLYLNLDTNRIDINYYIFNFQLNQLKGNLQNPNQTNNQKNTKSFFIPKTYFISFYTNTLTSQVDFGFLNNSYQAFTGGPFYYNPGMNVFFKLGTNDLFEDYKITGGVRFASNFNSNEYLLSFENLKKRLDKQLVFHRLALNKINSSFILKTHTHELFYIIRYPFNEVTALRFTSQFRYDRTAFLSTDIQSLLHKDEISFWTGLKSEIIYDNTIQKGLNILFGIRGKVFFESYFQTNKNRQTLYVNGFDIRYYQPIHRTFIWAIRMAGSNSFGKAKLIYYLGSVDNWINLSTKIPTFDPSIRIDYSQNYVYQAIATNMRGFSQNIRNGNNFLLLNNELRLPVFKYFANRPIHSDFLENFQIIGFVDAGTAWSGSSPYSKINAYNTDILVSGPITIIIDKKRDPIVWGYGFGLRSRILGYFVRADWAWGVENNIILPKIFYLSLSLDF